MNPKSTLRSFLLLAGSSLLAIYTASADNAWWDGVDGSWGDLTKWSSDDTGVSDPAALPTNAQTATFNITSANSTANNITLDASPIPVKILVFNTTGATNIRGNSSGTTARTLSFGGTASITLASGAGAVTIGDDPGTYGAVNMVMGNNTWTVTNSSLTVNGTVNMGGGALTIGTGDANGIITINGKISGTSTARLLNMASKSRVVFANDTNDFVGQLYVTGSSGIGTLAFTSIADYGTACALGFGTGTGDNPIQIGNGTTSPGRLEYIGTTDSSANRTVQLGSTAAGNTQAGEVVNNSANNSKLVFTAANFNPTIAGITATRTLTLGGTSTGANEIQGIIQDNDTANLGRINLIKSGTGKWILSGANTNTGAVTINDGTLLINGSLAPTNAVNVLGGTLGGTGTIGKAVAVGAAGNVAPGVSVGTLTLGSNLNLSALTGSSTGKLIYELGPIASSDKIDLTAGVLLIGAGALDLGDFDFTPGVGFQNGTYTLISTTKSISDNGGATIGTLGANVNGTLGGASILLQKSSDGKSLELVVSGLGGVSAYDTWKTANSITGTPDQDQDGDGVSNAMEFVLGGTSLTNDLGKLPVTAANGTDMTFTFLRKQSSIDPKTNVSIEVGTDLVTWNTAPSPYSVPDVGAANNPGVTVVKGVPADYDAVTLTVPQDSAKNFARLKVVITP